MGQFARNYFCIIYRLCTDPVIAFPANFKIMFMPLSRQLLVIEVFWIFSISRFLRLQKSLRPIDLNRKLILEPRISFRWSRDVCPVNTITNPHNSDQNKKKTKLTKLKPFCYRTLHQKLAVPINNWPLIQQEMCPSQRVTVLNFKTFKTC